MDALDATGEILQEKSNRQGQGTTTMETDQGSNVDINEGPVDGNEGVEKVVVEENVAKEEERTMEEEVENQPNANKETEVVQTEDPFQDADTTAPPNPIGAPAADRKKAVKAGKRLKKSRKELSNPIAESQEEQMSPTPQYDEDDPLGMMSCIEAVAKFSLFATKIVHPKKGFSTRTISNYPLIANIIDELGWEKLCAIPKPINLDWIRELYSKVAVFDKTTVKVRGSLVCFSPDAINKLYGLKPPKHTEYVSIMQEG